MESIENIKSTYRRIADEAQQQLNKVQRQIYRIGTLPVVIQRRKRWPSETLVRYSAQLPVPD